jgi:O-antigen/teichoic acid export membrane protein
MDRTRNYFNQVTGSIVYKFFSVIASFFAIPLMIASLGLEKFGIWSTLLTILNWFIFFDLGLGNGLRNRVAERLSLGDSLEAKHYIGAVRRMRTRIGLLAQL